MTFRRSAKLGAVLTLTILAVGCDGTGFTGVDGDLDPRDFEAFYGWEFTSFVNGEPQGFPMVTLRWDLPRDHADDPFRVYARNTRDSSYDLIATVTSCSDGTCVYEDINVVSGESYDYYVVTVDGWDGDELGSTRDVRVDVPLNTRPDAPAAPQAVALDGAVFLDWEATGARYYRVWGEIEGDSRFLEIGQTDGSSFLDSRAANGSRNLYYVSAVDDFGHVSALSPAAVGIARPDYHSDVVYAFDDKPEESGFRFVNSESENPIVSGSSASAQWRLESSGSTLWLRPLGQTRISAGTFTTSLTCGPESESDCEDISMAPSDSELGASAVVAATGNSYVLRVVGDDNQVHYAKVRVQGASVDGSGDRVIVFDWAYQLRANEKLLNRVPG